MKPILLFVSGLLALLFTVTAHAGNTAAQPQIVLQAWQVQSVVEAGETKERLQPLQQIRPGDVIEYEARYVNATPKAAQGVQLTLPVPAGGIRYLPAHDSATPVQTASLDGVKFEPVPLRRAVHRSDGRRVMEDVPLTEYRFLRWNLGDLPAGAQRTVRARMQLPPVVTASRS